MSVETEDEYQKTVYSYGSMTVFDVRVDTTDHPLIEMAIFDNIRTDTDPECILIIKHML